MPDYVITANNVLTAPYNYRGFKGEVVPVSFSFAPWADDNAALSSATWRVESGDVSISGQAFSANTASANITLTNEGKSLIKVSATNGTLTKVAYLSILAVDPVEGIQDYV